MEPTGNTAVAERDSETNTKKQNGSQGNRPLIRVMTYGHEHFKETAVADVQELPALIQQDQITWIDVERLDDLNVVAEVGKLFNLHQLALDDVVHPVQRAKVEQYGDHYFVVARMPSLEEERVETEQLSMFFGRGFVVTFQEGKFGDCLDPVRDRIRKGSGRIREHGSDHLAYCLLDGVIDGYFPVLEQMGERLEDLEVEILSSKKTIQTIPGKLHEVKRDLSLLRRCIWPIRDAVSMLNHDASDLIAADTRLYLRDCIDHSMRVMDMVEVCRELSSDLLNLHMSAVGIRMNEVMKVLTIITTLFIPPTLIAGIYGMNFKDSPYAMPELSWTLGYPYALGLMAAVMLAMLWWLKVKGWLSSK